MVDYAPKRHICSVIRIDNGHMTCYAENILTNGVVQMRQELTERQVQKVHTVLDRGHFFAQGVYDGQAETPYDEMHERYLKQLDGHLVTFSIGRVPGVGYVELTRSDFFFDSKELTAAGWVYMETGVIADQVGKPEVTVIIDFNERRVTIIPTVDLHVEPVAPHVFAIAGFVVPVVHPLSDERVGLEVLTLLAEVGEDPVRVVNRTFESFTGSYIGVGIVSESYLGRGYVPSRKLRMSDVAHVTGVSQSRLSALRNGDIHYGQMSHDTVSLLATYGSLSSLAGDIYNGLVKYYKDVERYGTATLRLMLKDGSLYETTGIRYTVDALMMQVYKQNASDKGEVSLRIFARHPEDGERVVHRDAIASISVDYTT